MKTRFLIIFLSLLVSFSYCFAAPPSFITITSPSDGSYISKSVTIEAQLDQAPKAKSVKFYVDNKLVGEDTTSPYRYTWDTTPYSDGQHTLYASILQAPERPGKMPPVLDSPKITITVDNTPPLALITSPLNNSISNTQTITVSGTIDDNQAAVTVNGSPASVSSGTFSCSGITLTQGQNTIAVTATDLAGNTSSASITVTYQPNNSGDTTPPSINVYTPDKDSTTRSNIIYGKVSDDAVRVTVNGIDDELLNSTFIARPPLAEGQNTVTVKAWDAAGNLGQSQISFTYNTATPKVIITSPLNDSTQNISPINIQGTNSTDIKFIIVNMATADINSTNFTAEGVTLDSAKTVVTASGYDASNNKFSDSIVVNSPNLANYELIKVSGDATETDPNRPSADSSQILKIKLEKNSLAVPNEEVQFRITQGQGSLSPQSLSTDINGEAQVTLTTDTKSDITNEVECYPTSNPLVRTTFSVDTKPGQPSILTKITDDSITPVPGATIPITVKLTDSHNNPIENETINLQITQGTGTLSSPTAVTNYYGEAKVNLTCPNLGLTLTRIKASSQTVPAVTATFNITTSTPLAVTVDDIINKVNYNDSKIQDITADITMTSNAPFLPSTMQLKIWQKGDKQKVEELSPNPQAKIRPIISKILQMNREIISYNPSTDVYVIKSKLIGQSEEYPYDLDHIDYQRGVIIKTERYFKVQQDLENLYVIEYLDFLQFNDVWGFQKIKETMHNGNLKEEYYIMKEYSNIQVNTGILDNEFN